MQDPPQATPVSEERCQMCGTVNPATAATCARCGASRAGSPSTIRPAAIPAGRPSTVPGPQPAVRPPVPAIPATRGGELIGPAWHRIAHSLWTKLWSAWGRGGVSLCANRGRIRDGDPGGCLRHRLRPARTCDA